MKALRKIKSGLNVQLSAKKKGPGGGQKIGKREILFLQNNELLDGLRRKSDEGKGKNTIYP